MLLMLSQAVDVVSVAGASRSGTGGLGSGAAADSAACCCCLRLRRYRTYKKHPKTDTTNSVMHGHAANAMPMMAPVLSGALDPLSRLAVELPVVRTSVTISRL